MTTQCEATFREFFATKLSFPKRFHCDLEGLYFRCCIVHINTFWSRTARTTMFFREKNRSACFVFCGGERVKVNFAKVNFLKTYTPRQHIQFAHRRQTILRVQILLASFRLPLQRWLFLFSHEPFRSLIMKAIGSRRESSVDILPSG